MRRTAFPRPDGLAFIIANEASESGFTGSRDEDDPRNFYSKWRSNFLEGLMCSWDPKDVFQYTPGARLYYEVDSESLSD